MFEDIGVPELKSVVRARSAVEDILERGRVFFRGYVVNRELVGLPLALQDALAYAGPDGFVATMPELIAARVAVAVPTGDLAVPYDRSHWLWDASYDVHSEENVGPNYTRRFYPDEEYLVVVVHGGGLLSPERLLRVYHERGLVGGVRYAPEEFASLLRGRLPDGELPLYSYDEIAGQDLPRRCGIVLPYLRAERAPSGAFLSKRAFLEHPVVIARNAGTQHLEEYFDRASRRGVLGCYHSFGAISPWFPQGRWLFLFNNHYGLHGLNLSDDGRFVGVAPARRSLGD